MRSYRIKTRWCTLIRTPTLGRCKTRDEMESVLEQQRKFLEERERVEDALVKEKMLKKPAVSEEWAENQRGSHDLCMY